MKKKVFCIALAFTLLLGSCNTSNETVVPEGETPVPTIYHSAVPTSKPPKTATPVRTAKPTATIDNSLVEAGFPSVLSKNTLDPVSNNRYVTMTSSTAGGMRGETAENLFDGNVETKLCTNNTGYIILWNLDRAYPVGGYSITTANDSEQYGRLPQSWKLEASADGVKWTEVSYITSSGMRNSNFTEYFYPFRKPATYQYFRFTLMEPTSSMTQMAEITLYVADEA